MQPPPSRLSPRAILALPASARLCNPPPAVGKVRSCSVTPVLDVRLDDVLARRHLPPIGLKDLEEYLLYVEHSPENLYFLLWLADYAARYHAWAQRERSALVSKKDRIMPRHPRRQTLPLPPTPDPALAMFYLRAKQTFFTPNAEYELNIPSDILAPFHAPAHDHALWHAQSVHPDPAVFTEVALEARNMLNESLKRFVRAAYTNVGSQRAVCGILAGCMFTLVAGVVPLVLTTGRWNVGSHARLMRLAAVPGLWFGLTVLFASLQGICLMIYIFGDLRQLRKFELARPIISSPMPLRPTHTLDPSLPRPPEKATVPVDPLPAQMSSTTLSCDSCDSECSSVGFTDIDISPAFFDDVPAPEGPATASCLHRPEYRLPPSTVTYVEPAHVRSEPRAERQAMSAVHAVDALQSRGRAKGVYEYGPTAGFIPNDYSTSSLSDATRSLHSQRSMRYFDFDLLPAHMSDGATPVGDRAPPPATAAGDGSPARAQYKCSHPGGVPEGLPKQPSTWPSLTVLIPSFTMGVPAFATPLTQVQSPVVKRAQWEVVVRAALVSAIVTGVLTGLVVGVVP